MDIATLAIRVTSDGVVQARNSLDGLSSAGTRAEKQIDSLGDTYQRTIGQSKAAAHATDLFASALTSIAAGSFLAKMAAVEREFGIIDVQLKTATGSADAARVQFAKLETLATQLPSSMQEVTNSFIKLKNLGLDPSEKSIISYANTAAAMGKNLTDMVEAVADASTGEFERLKEFGIKAKVQGDNVSLTFQGVTKTIGNNAAEIVSYLQSIGNVNFAGAATERMNTLDGAISNLGDSVDGLYRRLNDSGAGQVMIGVTQALAGHIDEVALAAGGLSAILAGRMVAGLAASTAAFVVETAEKRAALVANAQLAASELVLATREKELALLELSRARALGMTTAATEAAAFATANYNRALAAAEAANAAAAAGTSVLRGALGLLGGPIRAITTALSIGAMAWAYWGESASKATKQAREELARLNKEKRFGAGSAGIFNEGIAENEKRLKELQANRNRILARGEHTGGIDAEIKKLSDETAQFRVEAAKAETQQRKLNDAASGAGKVAEESSAFLTKQQQKQKELNDLQAKFNKETLGIKDQNKLRSMSIALQEKQAAIEEKYTDKAAASKARSAQRKAEAEAAKAARVAAREAENYGDLLNKLSGISSSYNNDLTRLNKAYIAGVLPLDRYQAAVQELIFTQTDVGKAAKSVDDHLAQSAIARKESSAQLAIEYQLYGQSADARDIAMVAIKTQTEAEKLLADMKKQGLPVSEAQIEQINAEADARAKVEQAALAQTKALGYAQQLADENRRFAAESIFDERERAYAIVQIDAEMWQERIRLAEEGSEAQRILQEQYNTWYANQLNKPAIEEWKKSVEQYDAIFRQGFVDMVNGGKDTWKSFTKSLTTTFKSTVADQIYKMFAQPLVVRVVGSLLGVSASGNALAYGNDGMGGFGGSGTGIGMDLGSVLNIGERIYDWGSGFFAGGAAAAGQSASTMAAAEAGTAMTSGQAATADWMMAQNAQQGFQASSSASSGATASSGWVGAGATLVGSMAGNYAAAKWGNQTPSGQRAGSYGAAGGAAVGAKIGSAWGPWGTAIGAVAGGILGGVGASKLFGHGGPQYGGEAWTGQQKYNMWTMNQGDASYGQLLARLQAQYTDLTKDLGGKIADINFGFGIRTDPEGTTPNTLKSAVYLGDRGLYEQASRYVGRDSERLQSEIEAEMSRMLVAALKASSLPTAYANVLSDINVNTDPLDKITKAFEKIQTLRRIDLVFDGLARVFPALSRSSVEARAAIIGFAGGLDSLSTGMNDYYQGFFTEAEKRARVLGEVGDALAKVGEHMPQTREEFRRQVEALDLTTASGQKTYAAMMSVSGAFAGVVDAAKDMVEANAQALLSAAMVRQQLVPALDAAALKSQLLGTTLVSTYTVAGNVSRLFLDVNSGLITFGGGVGGLTPTLTGVKQAADVLGAEIVDLRGDVAAAVVDVAGLGAAMVSTGGAAGSISRLFLDVGSGLITFGGQVGALQPTLTGAQRAAEVLNTDLVAMRQAASGATVNFTGLSAALVSVDTDTFVTTVGKVFDNLAERIGGVIDGISAERIAVREAALQVVNPTVLSKAAILQGIAGINTALPSNAGVLGAMQSLSAANAAEASSAAQRKSVQATVDAARAPYDAAVSAKNASLTAFQNILIGVQKFSNYGTQAENLAQNVKFRAYNYSTTPWNGQTQQNNAAYADYSARFNTAYAALTSYNKVVAATAPKLAALEAQHTAAVTAQAAALAQTKTAELAYADALQHFAIDASKSASKLSRLREETVKYYEAQKALADLMANSAAGLRGTVADYRYNQLTPEQQFAKLQEDYAKAYAMALSTDGETLAGYGDKVNSLLNPMLEKARDVLGSDSAYAAFADTAIARAEAIAGRLETLQPKDYQADSLAMLGSIDATLAALDASSRSAEQLIVSAINGSRDHTVAGLHAVVAALTGQAIPAFAAGGLHAGGLRLVGENGPELEVTGPSRIYNASQTRALMRGMGSSDGGNNAALLAEMRALRAEVANLRIEARATASNTGKTARQLERFDVDGLTVRTDADTPLHTEVVS